MAITFSVLAVLLLSAICYSAPTTDNVPVLEYPPECEGQRLCSIKPKGYELLEDRINRLLPEHIIQEYADRYGQDLNADDNDSNCPSTDTSEPVFSHHELTSGNKTKIELLVQTKLLTQSVISRICDYTKIPKTSNEDQPQCFKDVILSKLHKISSSCEPTMGKQTLLMYDPERNNIYNKTIEVQVACSCHTFKIQ